MTAAVNIADIRAESFDVGRRLAREAVVASLQTGTPLDEVAIGLLCAVAHHAGLQGLCVDEDEAASVTATKQMAGQAGVTAAGNGGNVAPLSALSAQGPEAPCSAEVSSAAIGRPADTATLDLFGGAE